METIYHDWRLQGKNWFLVESEFESV